MEPSNIGQSWIPHLIFAVIGVLSIIEMLKYKIRNDPGMWQDKLDRDSRRAASDPDFLARESADVEAKLKASPAPSPFRAISKGEERRWSIIPSLMLTLVTVSVILLYFGLFYIMPADGIRWHVYLGWALIVVVLGLYFYLERNRAAYNRARQLERKYRLQEAGNAPQAAATLRVLLGCYQGTPDRWLELAGKELAAKQEAGEGNIRCGTGD